MDTRLKELRTKLGLTQQEFADSIGIKRNTIANYETGRNYPIDAVVSLICKTYSVREEWLRTGDGPMFNPKSRDDQIMDFVAETMSGESDNFRRRLLSVLARLDEGQWELLERYVKELAGARPDDPGSDKKGEG